MAEMKGQQPQAQDSANGSASGLRVLLVEDDAVAANSLAHLLKLEGCRVETAADGPLALETAKAQQPDVVLLDLGLPGMDGYEVARLLLQQKSGKRPLLIAVTGFGGESERLRSYEVGIDLHLTKPVSIEELRHFLGRFQTLRRPAES
jgi:two-component system, chemotaxis family, CheB/CheR fusion protein